MHPTLGLALIVVSTVLGAVTAFRLRTVLPPLAIDGLMALSGAMIGVGGLLMLDDVNTASWIAGPAMLAVSHP
jgi:hypothetical protein